MLAFAFGLLTLLGLSRHQPALPAPAADGRRRAGARDRRRAAGGPRLGDLPRPLDDHRQRQRTLQQRTITALGHRAATFSHHLWLGLGTGGGATLIQGLLYPHNLLLEVATELGLVGVVALALALGGFIQALGRCWRLAAGPERLVAALLVSMFLTAFVNAQFSDPIQGNGSVWLWGGLAVGMSARLAARRSASLAKPER